MQEDNSMFRKILGDLEKIINNDTNFKIKSFSVVPLSQDKNKSPIILEQLDETEHHLGLESWCVKTLFEYACRELFRVRRLLKKKKLSIFETKTLNKYLIGALLINPDVTTFWNMKRELVEEDILLIDKELSFTKLVLSYKCKSNDTFSYRKWLIKQIMSPSNLFNILLTEFEITESAAESAENNYHAWTHRIWCLDNILLLTSENNQRINQIISEQLDFSFRWINNHVSQHSGFHYRQYIIKSLKNSNIYDNYSHNNFLTLFVKELFEFPSEIDLCQSNFISKLLDQPESSNFKHNSECTRLDNNLNYVCILLYELFYTLKKLFCYYSKHETIWYHRKFVIFHLLQWMCNCLKIDYKPRISFSNTNENINILDKSSSFLVDRNTKKFSESGEKIAKLFKFDTDRLESCLLYRVILDSETKLLEESYASKCPFVQKLANRYEKWLNNIACLR